MAIIYHITTGDQWREAQEKGFYQSLSLAEEGFIHCSESRQLEGVVERYFKGKKDLLKLVIDTEKLTSPLYFDWSSAIEDTFPHIYGPVNLEAVQSTEPV